MSAKVSIVDLEPQSLVEHIAQSLKQRLRTGQIVPGQRLIEADLTRQFNVSRGPIREAFKKLVSEGFLTQEHNRGISVRKMTRKEFLDQHGVREMVEGLSARLAAEQVQIKGKSPSANRLMSEMRKAVQNENSTRFFELNEEFHGLIAELSNNALLRSLILQLSSHAFTMHQRQPKNAAELERSQKGHEQIWEAIASGNPEAAEKAMRAHIRVALKTARQIADDYFNE